MLKQKGFTLIELVIVCSIIAILSSIAIPSYNHHMKNVQKLKVISSGTQVYTAFMWYFRENKNNPLGIMAENYIEKVVGCNITSVIIKSTDKITAIISYEYEGLIYNLVVYPELSQYLIKDRYDMLIYASER